MCTALVEKPIDSVSVNRTNGAIGVGYALARVGCTSAVTASGSGRTAGFASDHPRVTHSCRPVSSVPWEASGSCSATAC